jgi:DNA-directed RNA polymerase omega subunit
MMNYPSLNELVEKAGCRYMLVTAVANRARQLQDQPDKLGTNKPVSMAVDELYHDRLILNAPKEN